MLDAARIRAALDPQLRRRLGALDVHWQIDSTNSALAATESTLGKTNARLLDQTQVNVPFRVKLDGRARHAGDLVHVEAVHAR